MIRSPTNIYVLIFPLNTNKLRNITGDEKKPKPKQKKGKKENSNLEKEREKEEAARKRTQRLEKLRNNGRSCKNLKK